MRSGLHLPLPNRREIKYDNQCRRKQIGDGLRPHKTGNPDGSPHNKQRRNVDQTLTAEIDNQRLRRGAHGLQRVAQHVENAKKETGRQENTCKLRGVAIGIRSFKKALTI